MEEESIPKKKRKYTITFTD